MTLPQTPVPQTQAANAALQREASSNPTFYQPPRPSLRLLADPLPSPFLSFCPHPVLTLFPAVAPTSSTSPPSHGCGYGPSAGGGSEQRGHNADRLPPRSSTAACGRTALFHGPRAETASVRRAAPAARLAASFPTSVTRNGRTNAEWIARRGDGTACPAQPAAPQHRAAAGLGPAGPRPPQGGS